MQDLMNLVKVFATTKAVSKFHYFSLGFPNFSSKERSVL